MVSRIWMILAVFVFLGCKENSGSALSQSEPEADHSFDDSVQISPLFLCPPGEGVRGFDSNGQPVCDFAAEEGFPASQKESALENDFKCPKSFSAEIQIFSQRSTKSSVWVACFYDKSSVPRPIAFGQEAAFEFQCPKDSLLKGFDSQGRSLCESKPSSLPTLSARWDKVWESENFSCPHNYELNWIHFRSKEKTTGHWQARLAVCVRKESGQTEIWVSENSVARIEHLHSRICPTGEYVIGFDERKNLLCAEIENLHQPEFEFPLPYKERGESHWRCRNGRQLIEQKFFVGEKHKDNSLWSVCR